MDLKKELQQYTQTKKLIKEYENRIEKIRKDMNEIISDLAVGSSQYFPYNKTRYRIEGLDIKLRSKYESLVEKLKENKIKLIDKEIEIETYLDTLENGRIRRILTKKYFEDESYVMIALEMSGKNSKCTEDSIRMEHDRFLKNYANQK